MDREGVAAPDGSQVEVYRKLPDLGEAAIVHPAVPPGAGILELGCGGGRVTAALLALDHEVTGVDASAAMLSAARERAPGAILVEAAIEALDLGRRFPAVVLGSHLANGAPEVRRALLEAAARHVDAGGAVLVEAYPPDLDWSALPGRTTAMGPFRCTLTSATVEGTHLRASVRYLLGRARWQHAFEAELLDEDALRGALAAADLTFDRWLDRGRGWLSARPSARCGGGAAAGSARAAMRADPGARGDH
jgi:SAM-dependent methyltransferase